MFVSFCCIRSFTQEEKENSSVFVEREPCLSQSEPTPIDHHIVKLITHPLI